jgi:hypothetical protein
VSPEPDRKKKMQLLFMGLAVWIFLIFLFLMFVIFVDWQ